MKTSVPMAAGSKSAAMVGAGILLEWCAAGGHTLSADGSTPITAGAGRAKRRGASRRITTADGLKIRATVGSGFPVRLGARRGLHGAAAAAISAGRLSVRAFG